jgi:aryl-alcohol dehydrogenase-like predicted oxidoreductase
MNVKQLGFGLLSIGRMWGVDNIKPPSQKDAISLVHGAFDLGIRFFDTAPAYGASEQLFGQALAARPAMRESVTVATKMGECWRDESNDTVVSHSYDDLVRSIDSSMAVLGRIDILQVHKATIDVICSADLARAMRRAEKMGIRQFGASVSDAAAAKKAIETDMFNYLQFPLNRNNPTFLSILDAMALKSMQAITNRPFAMGALASGVAEQQDAFGFILEQYFTGVILTGTSSRLHLKENFGAFAAAQTRINPPSHANHKRQPAQS